jgi:DNA-binding protein HU-beta
MTKADLVNEISEKTGLEKMAVQNTVEAFMKSVRTAMTKGDNVYLRGFGSFVVKRRAEKTGRNISKNQTIIIPRILSITPVECIKTTNSTPTGGTGASGGTGGGGGGEGGGETGVTAFWS